MVGTVTIDWTFSVSPREHSKITCDVLPNCNYDLILGSHFLTATQTLTKYKRRLTECLFSKVNTLRLNLLGNSHQRLGGFIGIFEDDTKDMFEVLAVPDTGAEANVMDRR